MGDVLAVAIEAAGLALAIWLTVVVTIAFNVWFWRRFGSDG
jgi:hypothetical protein